MKRTPSLPLLLLCLTSAPALAQGGRSPPQACNDDFTDCREECSMDFGASTRTRKQLGVCVAQCQEKLDVCGERHHTKLDTGLAPGALERPRERDPAMEEPRRDVYRPPRDPEPAPRPAVAAPAPVDEEEDTPELPPPPPRPEPRPAPRPTLASDEGEPLAKPAAAREEPSKPAPVAEAPAASSEDEEPLPPPKPRVAQPTTPSQPLRPKPPPEPKYDISEWDPNGD